MNKAGAARGGVTTTKRYRLAAAGALLGAALIVMAPPASANHETLLVSRTGGLAGAGGDGDSAAASISSNGRFVAFSSRAANLSLEDNPGLANIFVRDAQPGTTTLVSRATGATVAAADADSSLPRISADGRFVAFISNADNLSLEDNNGFRNVFVRDLQTGTTTLVSRVSGSVGAGANGSSNAPSISADGRFVAFESEATNLSPGDQSNFTDIFVRDLVAGTTTLASQRDGVRGDDGSFGPSISSNGRFVAFVSKADNLSTVDNNSLFNVFVRDVTGNTTTLVSTAGGVAANDSSSNPSISGDGRFVAFDSLADNLSTGDNNSVNNVFVRDLQATTTKLVSITADNSAGGNGNSSGPSISSAGVSIVSSGRFVAFQSDADNLSPEDNNAVTNIFVRDTQAHTTTLVSRAAGTTGVAADGRSLAPSINADGTFVAFQSDANNLAADDNDLFQNVFRRHHKVLSLLPGRCSNKLLGTGGNDTLTGTQVGDRISGLSGNDVLTGLDGDDCLSGGKGRDRLNGGPERDELSGGPGADRISGGAGRDRVNAGAGRDRVNVRRGSRDRVNCGKGRDRVTADARDVISRNCEVVKLR